MEGAKEYLTNYVCDTMDYVYNEWWDFAWYLVGHFNDGMTVDAVNKATSGFPYTTEPAPVSNGVGFVLMGVVIGIVLAAAFFMLKKKQ